MAETYFVTHNAGGGGVGSEGDPFTIVEAADNVAAGDTVYVKASGDYIVQDGANDCVLFLSTVGTLTSPITWIGYTSVITDGGVATIDASNNTLANCVGGTASLNFYQYFKNFRFTGASANGFNLSTDNYFRFDNCRFDNNGSRGIQGANYFTFYKCQADNNTDRGLYVNNNNTFFCCKVFDNSDGFYLASNNVIFGCIVYGNSGSQIRGNDSYLIVINCSIDGNNTGTYGILSNTTYPSPVFINNIIFDNDTGLRCTTDFGILTLSDYNLLYSNNTPRTLVPVGDNDVAGTDDPFTNSASGDYTLKDGSEALEKAIDMNVWDTGRMDIGCYQKYITGGGGSTRRSRIRSHGV